MGVPLNEKQKAHLRRVKGVKARWAQRDEIIPFKVKEYEVQPLKATFAPKRVGKFGSFSGCKMSPEKRALVVARNSKKAAFMSAVRAMSQGS